MKRILFALTMLAVSLGVASCGAPAANNAAAPNNAKPANAANTAAAADPKAAEAEVRKLMDAGAAALNKNDADAMEKIYADNYMLVNIDGSVQTKSERLAAIRSGDVKYTSFAYSEPTIRIRPDGTGAIVIAKLSMKGTSKGKPMDGDYRVTHVYGKDAEGNWRQITAQATKIEGGAKADDGKAAGNANSAANTKTDPADAAPKH